MKEKKYSDADLLNFLVNTECLEAEFNSLAAFGVGMHPKLFGKASETPTGGKKADLSWDIQLWAEEVARDEIGHVRILHEALGADGVWCPKMDFDAGFSGLFNEAMGTSNVEWDPYKNDINFILSTFALEEIGATGDKGITGLVAFNGNATVVDLVGGLAQSAGYQAAADRFLLWTLRNETVPEFGKTVAEVTGAITQRRQALTGHVSVDQALVYRGGINVVPTEGNGVTVARTPQQVLSILTEGASDGKGGFFPDGVNGRITTPDPLNPPSDLNDLVRQANAPYVIVPSFKDVEDPFKLQNIPGPVDATKGSTAGVTEGTGSWFTSILPGVHDKEL